MTLSLATLELKKKRQTVDENKILSCHLFKIVHSKPKYIQPSDVSHLPEKVSKIFFY